MADLLRRSVHNCDRVMQIFSVSRQMLSLVAGDAIDVFLLGQLRLLREEHTLARLISSIQAALWPGGTWFMSRPEYKVRSQPPGARKGHAGAGCVLLLAGRRAMQSD